ncbi:HTH cro/C1-type domain-containing protein [Polynucleobacter arcticus]|uniref:HTH cro/C1-type domain-containing protein n=1 Tax=Polynucleobacter arcticus TaxID=1743165 RepID=A0A6M9PLA8_9BURK|nr:hypothetical protein DN92_03055 [Polynucleobacter arcticus]
MPNFKKIKAVQIGEQLCSARVGQGLSYIHLSVASGLSLRDLIHIETGNYYQFDRDFEQFLEYAGIYAKTINVNICHIPSDQSKRFNTKPDLVEKEIYIPSFLRVKSYPFE